MTGTAAHKKLGPWMSLSMVMGIMIGSGVFLLPRRFGVETGVVGEIIAWTIAGSGMLMLAFVFQRLANRKPDLDAGVYAYARAGFAGPNIIEQTIRQKLPEGFQRSEFLLEHGAIDMIVHRQQMR